MRINWIRRGKPSPVADTAPRRLADVDTGKRAAVTHLLRPDALSPRGLPSGAREVDTARDADAVVIAVERLGRAGGIDEFVPDVLDGSIQGWLAQADNRVDELLPEQFVTSLRLAGQEVENLTACAAHVQDLRATVVALDVEILNWEGVLRGEIEHLPFPQVPGVASPLGVDLEGLLAGATLTAMGVRAYPCAGSPGVATATPPDMAEPVKVSARQVSPMHANSGRGSAAAT